MLYQVSFITSSFLKSKDIYLAAWISLALFQTETIGMGRRAFHEPGKSARQLTTALSWSEEVRAWASQKKQLPRHLDIQGHPRDMALPTPAVIRVLYTSLRSSALQPKIGHDLGSARLSLITANPAGQCCPLQARDSQETLNSDS